MDNIAVLIPFNQETYFDAYKFLNVLKKMHIGVAKFKWDYYIKDKKEYLRVKWVLK